MAFPSRPISRADILYFMAAPQEYGPALKSRLSPVMTGIGPVEAAIASTAALAERQSQGKLPALAVLLGSAGSRDLPQLGIFQARSVAYRDMDASVLGFDMGETPGLGLPATLQLGPFVPDIPMASLSSGGNVISGKAYDLVNADMVDMESYAVLRACQRFDVPLVVLRGISDGVNELRRFSDWTEFLHVIDEKLAEAVDLLERAAAEGRLLAR